MGMRILRNFSLCEIMIYGYLFEKVYYNSLMNLAYKILKIIKLYSTYLIITEKMVK